MSVFGTQAVFTSLTYSLTPTSGGIWLLVACLLEWHRSGTVTPKISLVGIQRLQVNMDPERLWVEDYSQIQKATFPGLCKMLGRVGFPSLQWTRLDCLPAPMSCFMLPCLLSSLQLVPQMPWALTLIFYYRTYRTIGEHVKVGKYYITPLV